jgi:hypothetical protein
VISDGINGCEVGVLARLGEPLRGPVPYFYHGIIAFVCLMTAGTFVVLLMPFVFEFVPVIAGYGLVHFMKRCNPGMAIEFRHVRTATLYAFLAHLVIGYVMCLNTNWGVNSQSNFAAWILAFAEVGFRIMFPTLDGWPLWVAGLSVLILPKLALSLFGAWLGFKTLGSPE